MLGTTSRTGLVVGLYALGGSVIAFLLTLQEDSYCIRFGRGPGSLTCSYRSFFGWDAEPIVVEALFALIGRAIGAGAGLLVARWARRSERRTSAVLDDASRPA